MIEIAYKASELDMDFDSFKKMLTGWDLKPIIVGGVCAGVFFNKDSEIHFSILPKFRGKWFSRKVAGELLTPVLEKHGYITTMVPDNKPHGHKIVQKFGFKRVGRIQSFTVYLLEKMKWV